MKKLFRVVTAPVSLEKLLNGQWEFFKTYYDITAIASKDEELVAFGQANQTKTFGISLTRRITLFSDLKALWTLYFFFRKEKPLIVHTQTPKAGLIGV